MLLYRLFDNFIVLIILLKIYVWSCTVEIFMYFNAGDLMLLSIVIFKEINIFKNISLFNASFSFPLEQMKIHQLRHFGSVFNICLESL